MGRIRENIFAVVKERDFLAKLVCLLLAVILWAFIATGKTEKLRFKIPIVTNNLASHLTVATMSDTYASILLEGKKEHLKSVNVKKITVFVDMEDAVPDVPKEYPIRVEKHQIPEEVTLSLVNETVTVTVETRADKWIDVIPNIVGSVKKGKIIVDKTVFPERVKVSGPKSAIASLESVMTQPVSVENEGADFQRQVGLMNENHVGVSFGEKVFAVRLIIADVKDLSVFTVPVVIRNENKEYDYEIKNPEVEVYIRSRYNRVLAADDIEAFIDAGKIALKAAPPNEQPETMVLEVPVSVSGRTIISSEVFSIMPKKVQVRITKKSAKTPPGEDEKD